MPEVAPRSGLCVMSFLVFFDYFFIRAVFVYKLCGCGPRAAAHPAPDPISLRELCVRVAVVCAVTHHMSHRHRAAIAERAGHTAHPTTTTAIK